MAPTRRSLQELFYGVSEQSKAGKHRLDDARALLNADRWRGAMYMAGYTIECLLKTKLMQMYKCRHLRELEDELGKRRLLSGDRTVFTHELEHLMRMTAAMNRLRQNEEHWRLFNLVNRWIPAWRYSADLANRDDAIDFLEAVTRISNWIEHNI